MSTWNEAVAWMRTRPRNTASLDAMYQYRIMDGQLQRGTWAGNTLWLPHILSESQVISDQWDLLEPF